MSRSRMRSRPAFAAATAITLLALVGVVIASLATTFALDAKRTTASAEGAQLRQLLLAGAVSAVDRLNHQQQASPAEWDVPLPASLVERPASLTVALTFAPDGVSATAKVNASVSGKSARQALTFQRAGEQWKIADAAVD